MSFFDLYRFSAIDASAEFQRLQVCGRSAARARPDVLMWGARRRVSLAAWLVATSCYTALARAVEIPPVPGYCCAGAIIVISRQIQAMRRTLFRQGCMLYDLIPTTPES